MNRRLQKPREVVADLDELLFQPRGWFTIDVDNVLVEHAATHRAALQLLEAGRGTAVVGHLVDAVVAVDVDAGGIEGEAIAENLTAWLTAQGRWHLVRPSGGGSGRFHVVCIPGTDSDALSLYVEDLRTTYGLSSRDIDLRRRGASTTLRPLSSPHRRSGASPLPLGNITALRGALAHLRELVATPALAPARTSRRRRRADAAVDSTHRSGAVVALVPLPRHQRPIPAPWAAWFAGTGASPIAGSDQSRSAHNQAATSQLLRAGLDVDATWAALLAAPAAPLDRSRERGRAYWTKYHWNVAVANDTAYRTALDSTPRAADTSPSEIPTIVMTARGALTALQWHLGPTQRHSVLMVAHWLLDRMQRTDTTTVPCPQRDMALDTGLCRKTIGAALAALDGLLGARLRTYDPRCPATSSDSFVLHEKFTQLGSDGGASSLDTPPNYTHPVPPGTWQVLGPRTHSVWRALHLSGPRSPNSVAQSAGMAPEALSPPSARQHRTTLTALRELELAGLAAVDETTGLWKPATPGGDASAGAHRRRAAAVYREDDASILAERTAYRAGVSTTWSRARDAALRADRARQADWWAGMDSEQREQRRTGRAATFAALPQQHQATLKRDFARSRSRAGGPSERSMHRAWCAQLPRAHQADRSAQWQRRFAALAAEEQLERVRALAQHRRTWNLPHSWSPEPTGSPTGSPTASERPAMPDVA